MYARVTWSKAGSQPPNTEEGLKFYRESILPSLKTQAGFLGAVVLGNSETGEGLSATYWESAEAMSASEAMGGAARAEVAQKVGMQVSDIERFEVVLQDRVGPPMAGTFVRSNDIKAAPAQIDAAVALMRETGVPKLREIKGYRALLIFANRQTGRVLVSSVWETAADREAAESTASAMRREVMDSAQAGSNIRITLYEALLAEVSAPAQQAATAARTA
jgi:heme-degrading monooxygenase HmoA